MRRFIALVLILFFLSGCTTTKLPITSLSSTEEPAPTSTPAPTATNTPKPTYALSGTIFFDYNGSGLQDVAYDVNGEMVEEPAIPDVPVCLDYDPYENGINEESCIYSTEDGSYAFSELKNGSHTLYVVSPSDEPAEAFRYVNVWKREVTIEAYEMNGVQVPEQHLNDSEQKQIDETIVISVDGETFQNIGLLQGVTTLPFSQENFERFTMIQGFDHDLSNGVVDYTGDNTECFEWNYCEGKNSDSTSYFNGTGNQHSGIDFGYFGTPEGLFILSANNGYVNIRDGGEGFSLNIDVMTSRSWDFGKWNNGIVVMYGHCDTYLVHAGDYVFRGQIIGTIGTSGTNPYWSHIHFETQHGNGFPISQNNEIVYTFSKDFSAMEIDELIIEGFNDISMWTMWNSPYYFNNN